MKIKGGYFQVCVRDDGTYLHIVPGEEKLSVKEISDYLERKDLYFDILELDDAVNEERDMMLLLSPDRAIVQREFMVMDVSKDGMLVKARFYAPFEGGEFISKEELLHDLAFNNIVYGIDEAAIDQFMQEREYCKDIILARGKPIRESSEGSIEYLFNTDLSGRPALNEDGSVDYHNLNNVCSCTKGELLAVMNPEDPGEVGVTVWGNDLYPRVPKHVSFKYGKNVSVSEDGLSLVSDINGHVILNDEKKVIVSNVLVLDNVDTSTGDIFYDGDVEIEGNVNSGFQVSATGNVEVKGVVEGANVKAGGAITIRRGVKGMNRGILEAEGNVLSKFIENATVYAGGYVEADCILHSHVSAGVHVVVQGKKGFITGGNVRALEYVEAKTLGSDVGVATVIEVGVDPRQREEYNEYKRSNETARKQLERLEPVVKAAGERMGRGERMEKDQLDQLKEFSGMVSRLKDRIRRNTIEINRLDAQFAQTTNSCVRVTGQAYPGIKIVVSESALLLRTPYHYCRFIKEDDKVVMKPL